MSCQDLFNRKWFPPLIILVFALIAHGVLFVSDFKIWDDWWLEEILVETRWEDLQRVYSFNGMPLFPYFYRVFMVFPNLNYALKVFSFLCISFSALLTFRLLKQTGFLGKGEALMIALVSLTFPAFRVVGSITYSKLIFCYLIFLGASCLAFEGESQKGWKHLCLRIASLVGFFLSFHTGSLLVFYFGFFFALMLFEQHNRGLRFFVIPWGWILRRVDYISLPFVYWTLLKLFWPPQGVLKGHYDISFSVSGLLDGFVSLRRSVLVPAIEEGITLLFSLPVLFITVVLGCCVVTRLVYLPVQSLFSRKILTTGFLGFGFFLLVLGAFPYIVTRGGFSTYGIGARCSLLIPLPAAILLLALFRLLFYDLGIRRSRWILPVFLFMLCCFSVSFVKSYVSWQAKSVKELSFQHNLSQMEEAAAYTVFEVRDQFIIPETIDCPPFFASTIPLRRVFGDMRKLAFHECRGKRVRVSSKEGSTYTEKELRNIVPGPEDSCHYVFTEIDYSGKQCILIVRPGATLRKKNPYIESRYIPGYVTGTSQQFKLVMKHWYYKMINPESIGDFLRQVTSLELKPFQS